MCTAFEKKMIMGKRTITSRFSVWNGSCLIETLFIGFTIIASSNSTAGDDPPCLLPMDRILRHNCDFQCLRHQNELSPPSHAFPWPADSGNRISIGKMDQQLEVLLHCNNTHHFYQVRNTSYCKFFGKGWICFVKLQKNKYKNSPLYNLLFWENKIDFSN